MNTETTTLDFDWANLAFGSKKPLRSLHAIFIAAPRELSEARFKQIIKEYLPQGDIVLGISKEAYVEGFEGQPQFRMQKRRPLEKLITQVDCSTSSNKIYTLSYFQREAKYIFEKLHPQKVLLVNGSWKYAFHTQDLYYTLVKNDITYEMISPFTSEAEAKIYEHRIMKQIETNNPFMGGSFSEQEMLHNAELAAQFSFDYNFQTGVVLGSLSKQKDTYKFLARSFNKVVPFQTYAMHYGASREQHFSPPNDLNYYDTVHAEVMLILDVQKQGLNLDRTTLFINLLPCPTCARMFCETNITDFVYAHDHSDGYALRILQAAGKTVRRLVAEPL
jgi:deoxycytidylate deaminase